MSGLRPDLAHRTPREPVGLIRPPDDTHAVPTRPLSSYKIKESLEAAAAKLPDDSSVQTALGQWCYKVAGISFLERNAAKLLFGAPPESSYAEALSFLKASYEMRPSKKAALFAGLCQGKLGDKAAAAQWMEDCLALESTGEADLELDRQAEASLN